MSIFATLKKNVSPNSPRRGGEWNEVQSCPDVPKDSKKSVCKSITVSTLNLNDSKSSDGKQILVPPLELGASTSNCSSGSSTGDIDPKETKGCFKYTKPRHSKSSSISSIESSSSDGAYYAETSHCHFLVEKIFTTVGELESALVEDQNQEFQLRAELERKTEQARHLSSSLEAERKRNQRLMKLIQRGDNAYVSEDDSDCPTLDRSQENAENGGSPDLGSALRLSAIAYDCISPMLMQQRYEELNTSYQHCRHQLAKKEKTLVQAICEKEDSQAKYEALFDSFRNLQKSFEDMCHKYLHYQTKKKGQIEVLRDAVNCAGDVILMAQNILERCDCLNNKTYKKFKRNVKSFLKALRACDWIQHGLSDGVTSVANSN